MTPTQKKIVVTLGFCGLVSAADNWFVSPALPAIAQTLAIAPAAATIILTAYLTPYGLLQPVCGAIGDAVGCVCLLCIIVAGLAGSTVLCAAACLGLGYILAQPTLVSFSMDIDPSHTGLCTGLIGLGVFAGGGIGSSLGSIAIAGGGYLALWTIAGVALVAQAIAGARFLPRK